MKCKGRTHSCANCELRRGTLHFGRWAVTPGCATLSNACGVCTRASCCCVYPCSPQCSAAAQCPPMEPPTQWYDSLLAHCLSSCSYRRHCTLPVATDPLAQGPVRRCRGAAAVLGVHWHVATDACDRGAPLGDCHRVRTPRPAGRRVQGALPSGLQKGGKGTRFLTFVECVQPCTHRPPWSNT